MTAREFLNTIPIPSELETEDLLEAYGRQCTADFIRRVDELAKSMHAEYYENGAQDGDCDWSDFTYTAMRRLNTL